MLSQFIIGRKVVCQVADMIELYLRTQCNGQQKKMDPINHSIYQPLVLEFFGVMHVIG